MTTRGGRQARVKMHQRSRALKAARRRSRTTRVRPAAAAASATATALVMAGMVAAPGVADPGTDVTALVADLTPGPDFAKPDTLVAVGETLFFTLDKKEHWGELWRTDGTPSGTVLVKDIHPGPETSEISTTPYHLTAVGSTLFFTAHDGVHGRELWKSDGTAAGTVLVKDISSSTDSYAPSPHRLTAVGGRLFFTADDGTQGPELWKSDGTAAGTVLVKDIHPGGDVYDEAPHELTEFGGNLYFSADDGTHGEELWKSDGTAAGTVLVKDIVPGAESEYHSLKRPRNLTATASGLFFTIDDDVHGNELWRTDGSTAGTAMVEDVAPGAPGSSPSELTAVEGAVFFTANDGVHGTEVWRTDGTPGGTVLVKEIYPGPESEVLVQSPEYGGPSDFYRSVRPGSLTAVGSELFFTADDGVHHRELWTSDGTTAGTAMVKEIDPTTEFTEFGYTTPARLTALGNELFFTAYDGVHGSELWQSDGTSAGTALVQDINPSVQPGFEQQPGDLTPVGDSLFFTANDGVHGRELWRTGADVVADTTPPDTAIVSGPASGSRTSSQSVTFGFSGTPGDTAKVQCSLDGAAFTDCASPKTFAGLARTPHTVRFRAVDVAGNADLTPASRSFVVTAPSNVFVLPRTGSPNFSNGTVRLRITLPEPGRLLVAPVTRSPVRAAGYSVPRGTSTVVVKPTRAGLKALRAKLRKAKRAGKGVGVLAVKVKITFTPTGGTARSRTATYNLKLK